MRGALEKRIEGVERWFSDGRMRLLLQSEKTRGTMFLEVSTNGSST